MVNHKKKILKLAACLLLLGAACLISFNLIGSTVDESGLLHEPFILVIIGWLLLGLGIIGLVFHYIMRNHRSHSQK